MNVIQERVSILVVCNGQQAKKLENRIEKLQ